MRFNRFGSISHGTLRPEDLLPCFIEEAMIRIAEFTETANLLNIHKIVSSIIELDDEDVSEAFYRSDWVAEVLNEDLPNILQEGLPDFVYFGTTEGDGSDFGYWWDRHAFEDAIQDGSILKSDEIPDDWQTWCEANPDAEYLAVVTDHGNVTLYTTTGEEIWSIV